MPRYSRAAAAAGQYGELVEFQDNEKLITQGEQSSDVYFLLTGTTKIIVGKKEVDRVDAGRHVGEMAEI
ncbi:cyclic nucleotide-binding domain-containing protein [Paraburkholderia youngii]|uniref:cyclic nucleotide-binding domain-containing protein n=1 Tax=Paraburkholderia youngii TaxID=2782701 RepID=UPI0035E45173